MFRLTLCLWIVLCASVCIAQEPVPDSEQGLSVPTAENAQTSRAGGKPFSTDVLENNQNRWGFILSAYQGYSTDVNTVNNDTGANISAFVPKAFFNLGRRRSQLQVDLSAGYRKYYDRGDLNSWDYYGNARYAYQISRHTAFELSDQMTSSFNDSWSFISINAPINYRPSFSNEVMFNYQRITRNALTAEINTQIGRKATLGVFGSYNTYKYTQSSLEDADAFQVGANFDLRLTRWFNLTNSYSVYLNRVSDRVRDTQIHRLQVGGLDFHLTRNWRVWAGGGVEVSDEQGENRVGEDVNAGTEYGTDRATLSFTYQRGFTSGIGLSQLLMSDIYGAYFGHRLTAWLNANLETYYYRSSELDTNGLLETLSSGGGFQFAIRRNLIASVNCNYQTQKTHSFSTQGLDMHRFNAYVGLQYVWPSPHRIQVAPSSRGGRN
jgi:hypothetical protein